MKTSTIEVGELTSTLSAAAVDAKGRLRVRDAPRPVRYALFTRPLGAPTWGLGERMANLRTGFTDPVRPGSAIDCPASLRA